MLGVGFWICAALAVINFIVGIITMAHDDNITAAINFVAFVVCASLAGVNFALDYAEAHDKETERIIENIKSVQIDTTYIVNKEKVDTIYTISYFNYGN